MALAEPALSLPKGVLEASGRGSGSVARTAPGIVALRAIQRPIAVGRDGRAAQVVASVYRPIRTELCAWRPS